MKKPTESVVGEAHPTFERSKNMKATKYFTFVLAAGLLVQQSASGQVCPPDVPPFPVGTAFTYQGLLTFTTPGGQTSLVDDTCDFAFSLWDCEDGGAQVGPTLTFDGIGANPLPIEVTAGHFTVQLDFNTDNGIGPQQLFGEKRFLEVTVTCPQPFGGPVPLTPRQELTPTPHALYTAGAPWDGLLNVPADFADGTDDDTLAGLPCTDGQVAQWNNVSNQWQCADPAGAAGNFWRLTGNAGTMPGINFIGTSDNQALELHVNGVRALRIEPDPTSPNLIGGHSGNSVTPGVFAATIAGGGDEQAPNRVTDDFGTVGGGRGNTAGGIDSSVAGGINNAATGVHAVVGGGGNNTASGSISTVGGGSGNSAGAFGATVSGGGGNSASGQRSTVGGGGANTASGLVATISGGSNNEGSGEASTLGGGLANTASGAYATVPGGTLNTAGGDYSFAAGRFARVRDAIATEDADGDEGTFVWSDSIVNVSQFTSTGPNQFLIRATGGVGIGTNAPSSPLTVAGVIESTSGGIKFPDATVQTTAATAGFWSASGVDHIHNDNTGNVGIGTTTPFAKLQVKSGSIYGVWGETSNTGGRGVLGFATATTGINVGVYGQTDSTDGRGVFGLVTATTGTNYGVYGRSKSTSGSGVFGSATATTGTNYGVYGLTSSTQGRGVQGLATAQTGMNVGVYGETNSTSGLGVFGQVTATTGLNYGVFGRTDSDSGYAGYFFGRVHVTGNLSAGGTKPFKIDHPLDPENKILYHYALESPEVLNVYRGTVVLDTNGQGWAELPAYFQSINREFSYQLTAIGAPMPDLHVAREIQGTRFKIAGGKPGQKVSWQVMGIRNDPFVRKHGAPVEVEKPAEHRGKYLHPELYDMPEELGIHYVAARADIEAVEALEPVRLEQARGQEK